MTKFKIDYRDLPDNSGKVLSVICNACGWFQSITAAPHTKPYEVALGHELFGCSPRLKEAIGARN